MSQTNPSNVGNALILTIRCVPILHRQHTKQTGLNKKPHKLLAMNKPRNKQLYSKYDEHDCIYNGPSEILLRVKVGGKLGTRGQKTKADKGSFTQLGNTVQ